MSELIFATHNENKAAEIRNLTDNEWKIISLTELGFTEEIPEPFHSLEENATQKSSTLFQRTGKDCFGEDTGLEVNALGGAPGVKSARYAGPKRDMAENIALLLEKMKNREDRTAQFRTVISLFYKGEEYQFQGVCKGVIISEKKGTEGFGYDPIFIPDGADKTFAQMHMEEKNRYSHRAKAFEQFIAFLKSFR